ncbi:MAG: glycosyltransferase family 4 protein [Candidatus Micrarchaeota archaeon]|nr:glycosyltransferase family 4 protein [Candidatus Micrarchaeota archaeon]
MRIAYFVWEYPPRLVGGLGTYAAEITKKFDEMGHQLVVFTMNDGEKLPTKEQRNNITVHRPLLADATPVLPTFVDEEIKRWGGGLKFFSDILTYNFLSANKFSNEVSRKENFDIVVCHDWLSAIAGVIAKKNTNKPMVFHVHSTEHGRSGGGGSQTIRDLEFSTASYADRIITVSSAMRDELHRLYFPADRIRVCWNGVDEKKYDMGRFSKQQIADFRAKLGIKENDKPIVFTGRLTWVKGANSLLNAMPEILKTCPEAKLIILGRGEMADELKVLARQLNITNQVMMIDKWVDEEERIMLYASSYMVCAPSRYEPFGIVSLEGMSMGKPVLVGRGGLRESVVEGENGFYCEPDDAHDVAVKALKILSDPDLAARLGANGRERVLKHFTWDKIARDTIEIYQNVIEKKG